MINAWAEWAYFVAFFILFCSWVEKFQSNRYIHSQVHSQRQQPPITPQSCPFFFFFVLFCFVLFCFVLFSLVFFSHLFFLVAPSYEGIVIVCWWSSDGV